MYTFTYDLRSLRKMRVSLEPANRRALRTCRLDAHVMQYTQKSVVTSWACRNNKRSPYTLRKKYITWQFDVVAFLNAFFSCWDASYYTIQNNILRIKEPVSSYWGNNSAALHAPEWNTALWSHYLVCSAKQFENLHKLTGTVRYISAHHCRIFVRSPIYSSRTCFLQS